MQICIFITCKCFPYSVPGGGKKRKRKKIEQEEEADYEKRPRTIQTEQGHNERVLLPIKSKDSIIPRTEKIPIVGVYMYLFAWILLYMFCGSINNPCMFYEFYFSFFESDHYLTLPYPKTKENDLSRHLDCTTSYNIIYPHGNFLCEILVLALTNNNYSLAKNVVVHPLFVA